MREVPYETDQDVRARSRRDEMYERINDFLARGGRANNGGTSGPGCFYSANGVGNSGANVGFRTLNKIEK